MLKIRSKAPLRLGLCGGGTDIEAYSARYGGLVLNSTISLYVHCTILERADSHIYFEIADTKESLLLPSSSHLGHIGGGAGDKFALYKQIYNKLCAMFALPPLSFSLYTYSDVPSGSGLGGSSTLVVAILKAFCEWINLPLGEYDIAKLAYEIEREEVGIVGGAQDQYAATFGGFNFMEFYEDKKVIVNPLRIKRFIINELEESMVLYFTNITRSASLIEEEKINILHQEKSLEAMHRVKRDSVIMKEHLLKGELGAFAKVLGKSWENKKKVAHNISNTHIDTIYDIALQNGAYSGKVSGAGGGGFMFFMVEPQYKKSLTNALNALSGHCVPFSFVKEGALGWKLYE
ncbi:dehydrogenase [uncultured Helicobacter sp.]|uniref:GHMP family kinase ATP-binding protein n=1 Tax=uncultured Helicobacter sp. TaxID=175537 RepID=UPI0037524E27